MEYIRKKRFCLNFAILLELVGRSVQLPPRLESSEDQADQRFFSAN